MPFADPDKKRAYSKAYKQKLYATVVRPFGICSRYPDCKQPVEEGRKKCTKCLTYSREYRKVHRQTADEKAAQGLCSNSDCQNSAVDGLRRCPSCRAATKAREDQQREKLRAKSKQYHVARKQAVFAAYGGPSCACCGESHIQFLSIDHIKGNGAAHRREMSGEPRKGKNLYYWLRSNNYPPGFRVLCMNCNFALGHFGSCPHGGIVQQCSAGRRASLAT